MPRKILTINMFLLLNTYNQYTFNFLSSLAAEDLDIWDQFLQYLHPRQRDFMRNRHVLCNCTSIKSDSFKLITEKLQTRYVKYIHLKTALKLIMGISQNGINTDKKHCYLHKPIVRVFRNMTSTNVVRSRFYLVHHSNVLCSFTKLLQIALQPKPNCCWKAFSKMENKEK